MIKYLLTVMALLYSFGAEAQVYPHLSQNLSSSIVATNVFQSVQVASAGRQGCIIENTGTNSMYVYFGPIANATTANSAKLSAGMSLTCASSTGDTIATDQVSITGTITETYFANFQ